MGSGIPAILVNKFQVEDETARGQSGADCINV